MDRCEDPRSHTDVGRCSLRTSLWGLLMTDTNTFLVYRVVPALPGI